MRKIIIFVLLFLTIIINNAMAESTTLVVTVDELNGRAEPTTKSSVEMRLYKDDEVTFVSYTDGWVEIIGGETGTVFCKAEYLSEKNANLGTYKNISGGRVHVRDSIEGKRINSIAANKNIEVSSIILNWGYIGNGWVDLQYFEQ